MNRKAKLTQRHGNAVNQKRFVIRNDFNNSMRGLPTMLFKLRVVNAYLGCIRFSLFGFLIVLYGRAS